MATGERVFDWSSFPRPGDHVLPVRRFAAEVPYSGPPFVSEHAIATSRLTCAATDAATLRQRLTQWVGAAVVDGTCWPQEWNAH